MKTFLYILGGLILVCLTPLYLSFCSRGISSQDDFYVVGGFLGIILLVSLVCTYCYSLAKNLGEKLK